MVLLSLFQRTTTGCDLSTSNWLSFRVLGYRLIGRLFLPAGGTPLDPPLEGDLEGGVEEELKRLVWGFTHWVLAHRQRRETIPSFTTVCSYSGCSGHFCTSFLQASDSVLDPPREAQSVAGNSAAHQKIPATVSFQAPTTRWIPTQGSGPAAHPPPVDGS